MNKTMNCPSCLGEFKDNAELTENFNLALEINMNIAPNRIVLRTCDCGNTIIVDKSKIKNK